MRAAIRIGGITFMTGIAAGAVASSFTIAGLGVVGQLIISFVGGWLAFFAQVAGEDVK